MGGLAGGRACERASERVSECMSKWVLAFASERKFACAW